MGNRLRLIRREAAQVPSDHPEMFDEYSDIRTGKASQIRRPFIVCSKIENASWLNAIFLSNTRRHSMPPRSVIVSQRIPLTPRRVFTIPGLILPLSSLDGSRAQ